MSGSQEAVAPLELEVCQAAGEHVALAMDESPPVHSLLICPAQWSALLESTPVALVTRYEKGEPEMERDDEESVTPQNQGELSPERSVWGAPPTIIADWYSIYGSGSCIFNIQIWFQGGHVQSTVDCLSINTLEHGYEATNRHHWPWEVGCLRNGRAHTFEGN